MHPLRLAEILTALSQVTDLGMGQPPGTATRASLLAVLLARHMNLPDPDVTDILYTSLLQHIGCNAFAHETATLVDGDDIAFRAAGARVDDARLHEALAFMLFGVARKATPPARIRAVLNVLRAGPSFPRQLYRANCEVAVRTADRLGLPGGVTNGLDTIYARPDGKVMPLAAGQEIALAARFAQVAGQATLFHEIGGAELAIASIRDRAGTAFDPDIAATFTTHGHDLLATVAARDPVAALLDAEPLPHRHVPGSHLDDVARAFADIADLKSPWLHGHSTAVATLAGDAARTMGLPASDQTRIRLAGELHDIGRTGVPTGIWDTPGPLTGSEWEQVRLHAYHTERILAQSATLATFAPLAGMHHERLDGSGYHRGVSGSAIPRGARILAAADVWDAITHDRPYRRARPPDEAAVELANEARAGRLDPEVVTALLAAAGQGAHARRHAWPDGLTDREVEVLRLAAHGLSNREIGVRLSISPKTAGHHIQHIYGKVGVTTRAGAALYTMEHGLLTGEPDREMG